MLECLGLELSMAELFNNAESGDIESQYLIGVYHQYGVEFDLPYPDNFRANIESLSVQGGVIAQYEFDSIIFKLGQSSGIKINYSEAMKWYQLAAEQGLTKAQYMLANMFRFDYVESKKSLSQSFKWYHLAAEQGFSSAQYELSHCYESGFACEQNQLDAIKWCLLAAEQGHLKAQKHMGILYHRGKGVAKNEVEAIKWFRLAAEQGDADAIEIINDYD
mgnify:CR=1 FL=1